MARKNSAQARKAAGRKASRIRGKIADGTATDTEIAFLADYDANKLKPGRKPKAEGDDDDDVPEIDPSDVDTVVDPDDVTPIERPIPQEVPITPPPPPPPMPKLAPPPRVRVDADDASPAGGKGSDWREKYRKGPSGSGGSRELTVTQIADKWRDVLLMLSQGMEAAGVKPLVDPNILYPSMVLVVDEVLPAHVELTPKMIALGGTTALIVQRFMRRGEIAAHQAKQAERDEFTKRNEERRERAEAKQAEPEPVVPESAPEPEQPLPGDPPVVNGTNGARPFHGLSSREILAADPTAVI